MRSAADLDLADPLAERCLSIDDLIAVVNASLTGCAPAASDG